MRRARDCDCLLRYNLVAAPLPGACGPTQTERERQLISSPVLSRHMAAVVGPGRAGLAPGHCQLISPRPARPGLETIKSIPTLNTEH